ncbi:MAG: type IV pilus secretin PilQ [Candidatus Nitrohelix vancouverensis]|uniref:Type IV pilus secretin PilQ n=1 Tax=Candidatus Nitrohelix vancouverensis TaxID=2705534 RepID=A0A7T0G2T8_9BACT|nr:MAG: type IV pilus secretin PilQ [Candidatus Nitrohelix vancouverensis]
MKTKFKSIPIVVLTLILSLVGVPQIHAAPDQMDRTSGSENASDGLGRIAKLDAHSQDNGETSIQVASSRIMQYTAFKLSDPLRLVLDISDMEDPGMARLDRNRGLAKTIRPMYFNNLKVLRLEIELREAADYNIERPDNKNLIIHLRPASAVKMAASEPIAIHSPVEEASVQMKMDSTASSEKEAKEDEILNASKNIGIAKDQEVEDHCKPLLDGEKDKISLDFQGADLANIFRLFSEVSGFNIIIAPNVTGNVNIRLMEVPWNTAFDLILRNNSLGRECFGKNVIRVANFTTLRDEEIARNEAGREKNRADQASRLSQAVTTEVVRINYANIVDMAANLNRMIVNLYQGQEAVRASVTVDARTNTLIITDIPPHINEMLKMVRTLDVPTPQVMIEARIVEVSKGFTEELGVQWGLTGNLPRRLNPGGSDGSISINSPTGITAGNANGGFLVDLATSSSVGAGGVGGFDIVVGNIFGTMNLELQLRALETQSKGRILASPKVTTADNREARISSGNRIPFETTSNNGGTAVEFIDAEIELTVTPHITQDDYVYMTISATRNGLDSAGRTVGTSQNPILATREASTEVLVADGATTVLGGVYENTTTNTKEAIPFFSKIPVLGWFFRGYQDSETISELLIFITPTIVKKY